MADEIHKFNRGDVAEGILGAALVAKFANRPKSLEDKNWFATERKQLFSDYIKFDDGKSTMRLFNHIIGSFQKTENLA